MSYDPQKNRRKRDGCKPSLPTTIFIDCLALHSSDNYLIQSSGGLSAKANQLAQTILIFADNTGFGWRSIFSVCRYHGWGSGHANYLTLYNKHHKIKPFWALADPFWGQNHTSKKRLLEWHAQKGIIFTGTSGT